MLVESRGLPRDSTCAVEAKPGKLDVERREPGILFISLSIGSDYGVIPVSVIGDVIQKVQRHQDLP